MTAPDTYRTVKWLGPLQSLLASCDQTIAVCAYNQLTLLGHIDGTPYTDRDNFVVLKEIVINNL